MRIILKIATSGKISSIAVPASAAFLMLTTPVNAMRIAHISEIVVMIISRYAPEVDRLAEQISPAAINCAAGLFHKS